MSIKSKFKWEGQERSVFEIVSEDGIMQPNEILFVVQQICNLLNRQYHDDISKFHGYIYPKNIIIDKTDRIKISESIRPVLNGKLIFLRSKANPIIILLELLYMG